ncbi:MAG: ferredoxin-type protein NapH [Kiritimatiellia bacterium]|jgi:ferredoxin-type protein NapH
MSGKRKGISGSGGGRSLLILSVFSRFSVLVLLCLFALWTEYLNLKVGYNSPRLVELAQGKAMRTFYETSDTFFGWFGDPVSVMQKNGGMTWSIRVGGLAFTDPVAGLSVFLRNHFLPIEFALGLIIPLLLAVLFGRVFCTYICPASLLFFTIARIRRLLSKFFYFPELEAPRGLAWGVLLGGLIAALMTGHGIWILLLPYFGIGQTIFHALAFGTLSIAIGSVAVFAMIDLCLGRNFTCRYLCPTGRLLGCIGRKSLVGVRREADLCLPKCTSCTDICPLNVNPKFDQTLDCSLCGECLVVCPTNCLSIGVKHRETAA